MIESVCSSCKNLHIEILFKVFECSGWNINCMDSGNLHHVVGADESCISWGMAQNGELGYGPLGPKYVLSVAQVNALTLLGQLWCYNARFFCPDPQLILKKWISLRECELQGTKGNYLN